MVASLVDIQERTDSPEQRLRLEGVSWQQYDALVNLFIDQFPALRMTYLEGILEIMSTSSEHERLKTIIARLIEAFAEEFDIDLNGYGAATFRKEAAKRGLEPDECYCFGVLDEAPDIAIEVVLSSGSIDKLAVYQGLNVQEVWFWENGKFDLYGLNGSKTSYDKLSTSQLLPPLDFSLLAQFVDASNQTQAVKAFRQAIRNQ